MDGRKALDHQCNLRHKNNLKLFTGERRVPGGRLVHSAERVRGYAPAITPLVVGFLLLLAVLLVLGLRAATKMDDVASNARILTQGYSARLSRILELRLRLNQLDSEARVRDVTQSVVINPAAGNKTRRSARQCS